MPHGDATAVFQTLCPVSNAPPMDSMDTVTLEYHIYNQFCNAWEKRESDPQPFLHVSFKATPEDATPSVSQHLSSDPPLQPPTMPWLTLAASPVWPAQNSKLGLERKHLIPITMKLTAANNCIVDIAGTLALRVSGTFPSGDNRDPPDSMFHKLIRLYLSKQACVTLDIISNRFPTISEAAMPNSASVTSPATGYTRILPHTAMRVPQTPDTPPHQQPPPHSQPRSKTKSRSRDGCWNITNPAPSVYASTNLFP